MEQGTALTLLSALTLLLQAADAAMAICPDEKAFVEKKMVTKERFL